MLEHLTHTMGCSPHLRFSWIQPRSNASGPKSDFSASFALAEQENTWIFECVRAFSPTALPVDSRIKIHRGILERSQQYRSQAILDYIRAGPDLINTRSRRRDSRTWDSTTETVPAMIFKSSQIDFVRA